MDTAFVDLEILLNQSGGSKTEQLASIARRIRDQSREFLYANQTFITKFNVQASSRSVLNQYRSSAESSLDAYIEESSNRYTPAAELIKHLTQLDHERL
jgi:hypothetical protein